MSHLQGTRPRPSGQTGPASRPDLDNTDVNMLMLRAGLENRIALEPLVLQVKGKIVEAEAQMSAFLQLQDVDGQGTTPEQALRQHRKLTEFKRTHSFLRGFIRELDTFSTDIEKSHHNIIRSANIRADTQAVQEKCEDHSLFIDLLQRFMVILQEQMPPAYYAALRKRIDHDINEIESRLEPME